jgi:hypothetical protein
VTSPTKKWSCSACREVHAELDKAHACCQPEVKQVWICQECQEHHEHKENAVACCKPHVESVWACGDCNASHDSSEEANECCDEKERCQNCMRDHVSTTIQAVQVQIAGHCDHCNPHYPIEQQHEITAAHERIQDRHE